MKIVKALSIVALLLWLAGCAVVSDKGRYDNIASRYAKSPCIAKKEVVLHVTRFDTTIGSYSLGHSSEIKKYEELFIDHLEKSRCFSRVTTSPFPVNNKKDDVIYVDVSRNASLNKGVIPVITPILSLALPMTFENEMFVNADVYYNGKTYVYEIEDKIKAIQWSLCILAAPFANEPHQYVAVKDKDLIDALIVRLKSDGVAN